MSGSSHISHASTSGCGASRLSTGKKWMTVQSKVNFSGVVSAVSSGESGGAGSGISGGGGKRLL